MICPLAACGGSGAVSSGAPAQDGVQNAPAGTEPDKERSRVEIREIGREDNQRHGKNDRRLRLLRKRAHGRSEVHKMKKSLICLALSALMICPLAACGDTGTVSSGAPAQDGV